MTKTCRVRLGCGHSCLRQAHDDDPDHSLQKCTQECAKLRKNCGHPCSKLCHEDCDEGECDYPVLVKLPCEHEVEVPCYQSGLVQTSKCERVVEEGAVGRCGHTFDILCWEKRSGGKKCPQECGGVRRCGHKCLQVCSSCCFSASGSSANAVSTRMHSGECQQKCNRMIACGHVCDEAPCHEAKDCPPCSSRCSLECEHSVCSLKCKEVCYCCSMQCDWECTCNARRKCDLLCETPCSRLPCDQRCKKELPCGHRCPSLCGEICPDKKFCVECARLERPRTINTRELVVDMILMTHLKDVCDSQILALPCGHVFTVETLDGHLGMNDYYEKAPNGRWMSVVPLNMLMSQQKGPFTPRQKVLPGCITCRAPVSNIRRYRRILNLYRLQILEQKWIKSSLGAASQLKVNAKTLLTHLNSRSFRGAGEDLGESVPSGDQQYLLSERLLSDSELLCEQITSSCPSEVLRKRQKAASQKNRKPVDEGVADMAISDSLPYIQGHYLITVSLLLASRVACIVSSMDLNDGTSEPNEGCWWPKEETTLALKLSKAERFVESALVSYGTLRSYCHAGEYTKTDAELAKSIASHLFQCYDDFKSLRNILPDIDGGRNLRLLCIETIEGLSAEFPSVDCAAYRKMRKLEGPYYDQVTEEEKRMVFKAMLSEFGSATNSYGGHWYRCPKGHSYSVGNCGAAVQVTKCPECGARIGGTNMVRLRDNDIDPEFQNIARSNI